MKFLTVKNIWNRIKGYFSELRPGAKQLQIPIAVKIAPAKPPVAQLERMRKYPTKKYCFKYHDQSSSCSEHKDMRRLHKTKKIQKQRQSREDRFPNLDELEPQKVPCFRDGNGVQLSSIGKRSMREDNNDFSDLDIFLDFKLEKQDSSTSKKTKEMSQHAPNENHPFQKKSRSLNYGRVEAPPPKPVQRKMIL